MSGCSLCLTHPAFPSARARRWGILYMAQMNPLINPILGE
jgi:hypothetical protein